MSEFLEAAGVRHVTERWQGDNPHYRWLDDFVQGTQAIRELVAPGERFVLIDEDQWECRWGRREVVEGRFALPFIERDGVYWGNPPDDATAIAELERLCDQGLETLVVGPAAYWWFDAYPAFAAHVASRFERVIDEPYLLAFSLRSRPRARREP